jgi:phosphatidylinositol glycan class B
MDFFTFRLSYLLFGNKRISYLTFILSLGSWIHLYLSTRSLYNSIECALTIISLFFWFKFYVSLRFHPSTKDFQLAFFLICFSFVIRPTSVLIWIPISFHFFFFTTLKKNFLASLFLSAIMICSVVFFVSLLCDYFFYQRLIFPPFEFFRFNVLHNLSSFYGTNSLFYYFYNAIPTMLLTFLPFTMIAFWKYFDGYGGRSSGVHSLLSWSCLFVILSYSLLAHKEFRFIYPLIPLMIIYSSTVLIGKSKILIVILLMSQFMTGIYFSSIHQRGVISTMEFISSEFNSENILFLMPCHSTPFQSHVHKSNINMTFLTCNPPVRDDNNIYSYKTEQDLFYENPQLFMTENMRKINSTIIIFFENLLDDHSFSEYFSKSGFKVIQTFWNSHFIDDDRKKGNILISRKFDFIEQTDEK